MRAGTYVMASVMSVRIEPTTAVMATKTKPELADSEKEDLYEVERIIDMRDEQGVVIYRVRWKNYCSDDDTWEPEAHLKDCHEVLLAFKKTTSELKAKKGEDEPAEAVPVKPAVKIKAFDADSESDSDEDRPTEAPVKKKKHKEDKVVQLLKEKEKKKKMDKVKEGIKPVPAPESDDDELRPLTPLSPPKSPPTDGSRGSQEHIGASPESTSLPLTVSSLATKEGPLRPSFEGAGTQPIKKVFPPEAKKQRTDNGGCRKHDILKEQISSADKCCVCLGPHAPLKWLGLQCSVCATSWHINCFQPKDAMRQRGSASDVTESEDSEDEEDPDYVPDTENVLTYFPERVGTFGIQDLVTVDREVATTAIDELATGTMGEVASSMMHEVASSEVDPLPYTSPKDKNFRAHQVPDTTEYTTLQKGQNFCFICKKPAYKIARHLSTHKKEDQDVAKALSFPAGSKMRRESLEELRNRGNFMFNNYVLQKGKGALKVKRKPITDKKPEYCQYCKGMFVRTELWRHTRRCHSRPTTTDKWPSKGRRRVLRLASMLDLSSSASVEKGVLKLLSSMQDGGIANVVRNDVILMRFAESLFSKHGHDISKHDYLRQKIRELGRFLLTLRQTTDIVTMEDTIKPSNFLKLIKAVKELSGYDSDQHTYRIPSLALKIGRSLVKVCDIVHCRALIAEDKELIESTEAFQELYRAKWSEYISNAAQNTISELKYNKSMTLPLTDDVVKLHAHLDTVSRSATAALKEESTEKNYSILAKATLTKMVLFNRRRVGEISKMRRKDFSERQPPNSHEAFGLSEYENKLCSYFERAELRGKRGRKVAVLLTPEMVASLNLLIEQRKSCGVPEENGFLFAVPHCQTYFRGHQALRKLASECGAKRPDYLRSTQLRKRMATTSQIMNLKNSELVRLADFLGHDITVHRQFYRLSEPTIQSSKISKLLIALENGRVHELQGKSLDEIGDLSEDSEGEDSIGSDASEDDAATNQACTWMEPVTSADVVAGENASSNQPLSEGISSQDSSGIDSTVSSHKPVKSERAFRRCPWTRQEISAVMRHFKMHIQKGHPATKSECDACKKSEYPALEARTHQNIRDFVRNKGVAYKRKNRM